MGSTDPDNVSVPGTISSGSEYSARKPILKQPRVADINDIDYERLDALHQEFLDRWNGEDNGLTMDEFSAAIKRTAGFGLAPSEIERIYSKIDSKGAGLMRWTDYIASLSQTAQLKAYMAAKADKPLFMENIDFIKTKYVVRVGV